ncbi:MAG: GIY-YIG nuclease family protein, partial [Clostridia bacterium]|nr:GIY-YIG nuclease family protein [Clostridia bacterium]
MSAADELLKPRPEGIEPKIYAFSLDHRDFKGWLKVGYTTRDVETRVKEEVASVKMPAKDKKIYRIELVESAMRADGTSFMDKEVFPILKQAGAHPGDGEWFRTDVKTVRAAVVAARNRTGFAPSRTEDFTMRREQREAVDKTAAYFAEAKRLFPGKAAKFLWNAKMRFGKTFATYQLVKRMGLKKILILTFKPAVESAWDEDLRSHVDFKGWQFVSRPKDPRGLSLDEQYARADKKRPIICFGSFQDFLGTNETGGIKAQHEWTRVINWDLVVFDEYHFGAWRDTARKLFLNEDEETETDWEEYAKREAGNAVDEDALPITTDRYLFLSGTPFRAVMSGEFIEEQIFNWTYADEQQAKAAWTGPDENPYAALPQMVLMTYKVPDAICEIARQGEFDEFDLNEFFAAEGTGPLAVFRHKDHVQRWLDLIRGAYLPAAVDEMRLGGDRRPPMPYRDARLLGALQHTLWFLPGVAACDAMENLLAEKQNLFYHDYNIANCSGAGAGVGLAALPPVLAKLGPDPLKAKSITLTCGKLTTGV